MAMVLVEGYLPPLPPLAYTKIKLDIYVMSIQSLNNLKSMLLLMCIQDPPIRMQHTTNQTRKANLRV